MPSLLQEEKSSRKQAYLSNLFEEIYFKDIVERYEIHQTLLLSMITDDLCSSIGSLTNASKIARALSSSTGKKTDSETVSSYIKHLSDSFLFHEAKRYDVKGKRYFQYPSKFYCADIGLRNARLNFRQQEDSHIMENIIFNELLIRDYQVDVGIVDASAKTAEGRWSHSNLEVDFVVNKGMERYYIQCALIMDNEEKERQEKRPLLALPDNFKKIIITQSLRAPWIDEDGFLRIGLLDFLIDESILHR